VTESRLRVNIGGIGVMKCPECKTIMVKYERDGRIWYDCPRCGFDFCDDDDYTHDDDS